MTYIIKTFKLLKRILFKNKMKKKAKDKKVVKKIKKIKKVIKPKKLVKHVKKVVKKILLKKEVKKEINYIEVKVKCAECGKEVKIVTLEGTDNSDYLCPKCTTGDFFEDDDEG